MRGVALDGFGVHRLQRRASGCGRRITVSLGACVRIQSRSFGVNPGSRPGGAGTTIRSKGSASQRRCSAWIGVRPLSIRASTGTPAFSAAFSTASSSGIASATCWCIGASSANSSGVTMR